MSGGILKAVIAINVVVIVSGQRFIHANQFLKDFCKTTAITESELAKGGEGRYECPYCCHIHTVTHADKHKHAYMHTHLYTFVCMQHNI